MHAHARAHTHMHAHTQLFYGVEYVVRAASCSIDEDDFLNFESNVFKSLFNDAAHNAALAKSGASKLSYEHSIKAIITSKFKKHKCNAA